MFRASMSADIRYRDFRSTHGEFSPTPNWIVGNSAAGGNNTPNPAATPPRIANSLSGLK
jgi:hypothetical protein